MDDSQMRYRLDALIDDPQPDVGPARVPESQRTSAALLDPPPFPRGRRLETWRKAAGPPFEGTDSELPYVDPPASSVTTEHRAIALRVLERAVKDSPGFKGLRIGFDSTPGRGHQSASAEVYREIRALGFKGPVQLVVKNEESKSKVDVLLQAEDRADSTVVLADAINDVVALAIVGAHDGHRGLRALLRAKEVLVLQPLEWLEERGIWRRNAKELEPLAEPPPIRRVAKFKHLDPLSVSQWTPAYSIVRPRYDSFSLLCHEALATDRSKLRPAIPRASAMACMIWYVLNAKVELCVAYGKDVHDHAGTLVTGIRNAQSQDLIGGTIVMWFEWQGRYPSEKLFSAFGTSVAACDIAGIDQTQYALLDRLNSLVRRAVTKKSILVVKVGSLPSVVFNECLALSTLPPLIEGANTRNFMRTLGRPYLSTAIEFPLKKDWLPGGPKKTWREIGKGETHFTSDSGLNADRVLEYIVATKDRTSRLAKVYELAGRRLRLGASDQLVWGLNQLDRGQGPFFDKRAFKAAGSDEDDARAFTEAAANAVTAFKDSARQAIEKGDDEALQAAISSIRETAEALQFPRVVLTCDEWIATLGARSGARLAPYAPYRAIEREWEYAWRELHAALKTEF
jgi:hypothetical protein